jgi:hypothetical protein
VLLSVALFGWSFGCNNLYRFCSEISCLVHIGIFSVGVRPDEGTIGVVAEFNEFQMGSTAGCPLAISYCFWIGLYLFVIHL